MMLRAFLRLPSCIADHAYDWKRLPRSGSKNRRKLLSLSFPVSKSVLLFHVRAVHFLEMPTDSTAFSTFDAVGLNEL